LKEIRAKKEAQKCWISLVMKDSPTAFPSCGVQRRLAPHPHRRPPADLQIAHGLLDEEHLLGEGARGG
jgi:hypothetical protein